MAKSKGSGAGGHAPLRKTASGTPTAAATKTKLKQIDAALKEKIAEIKRLQAGGEPATEAERSRLAEVESQAQRLMVEQAGALRRLQSEEAKIAAQRSELGVEMYAAGFKSMVGDGPYDFPIADGANAWGVPKYESWAKSLSKEERKAILNYTDSSSEVNKLLRRGEDQLIDYFNSPWLKDASGPTVKEKVQAVKDQVKQLDAALKKAPRLSEDIQAVRYFNLSSLYDHQATHGTLNGAIVQDKGFISTSLDKDWTWGGGFKGKILIPKGSQGGYINKSGLTWHNNEYEYMLPRGTKFKIIKTKPINDPETGAKMELTMIAYTPNHPKYKTLKTGFR